MRFQLVAFVREHMWHKTLLMRLEFTLSSSLEYIYCHHPRFIRTLQGG